jgi:hypothetical protein
MIIIPVIIPAILFPIVPDYDNVSSGAGSGWVPIFIEKLGSKKQMVQHANTHQGT